jgi:transcriptional regulator with XRE-family HTH domain
MDQEDRQSVLDFCSEVRGWRKDLGMSQAELSRLLGASPSWVSMMEHGDILPAYAKRQQLRLVLEELEFKRAAKRLRRIGTSEDSSPWRGIARRETKKTTAQARQRILGECKNNP